MFTSAGQDGGGAILAGALLIIDLVMAPGTRSERVRRAHSIYGRCEVIIENDIPAGQKHPQPHPCTGVRLTLKKSSDGEERTTWIDGSEFQMDELTSGDYKLVAYSERFETEAHLERVRPGQALNIQIKLKRE